MACRRRRQLRPLLDGNRPTDSHSRCSFCMPPSSATESVRRIRLRAAPRHSTGDHVQLLMRRFITLAIVGLLGVTAVPARATTTAAYSVVGSIADAFGRPIPNVQVTDQGQSTVTDSLAGMSSMRRSLVPTESLPSERTSQANRSSAPSLRRHDDHRLQPSLRDRGHAGLARLSVRRQRDAPNHVVRPRPSGADPEASCVYTRNAWRHLDAEHVPRHQGERNRWQSSVPIRLTQAKARAGQRSSHARVRMVELFRSRPRVVAGRQHATNS